MRRALVTRRVLVQVQLMVRLSIPPLTGRQDLSDDTTLPPLLIHLLCYCPSFLLLLLVVEENAAPVLRSRVRALAVRGRGVVHLVEELDESAVADLLGVVYDLQGFGICNIVSMQLLVRHIVEYSRPVRPLHTAR